MRNDLTQAFIDAMNSTFRKPIQLVVFHFDQGNVYLSDRDVTIDGINYKGLVEDWGTLVTSAYDTSDIISETLETTITLWNGGSNPFSNYFLYEEPINVEVDLYQTFEGLLPSDMALIGNFVIQDPLVFNESSRLLNLDLVSLNMVYTANIGKVLTKENYPDALESDLNKGIDLLIGDVGEIKTLCAVTPKKCTMKGSILELPTVVNVYEDLNELNFPSSGYIVIDEEILYYNLRDSDTFNITRRNQLGTKVSDHSDGVSIQLYITNHTYIIGEGPISNVTEVKANGVFVDPSEYVLSLNTNPALIIFPNKPSYIEYTKGARTEDIDFDAVGINNKAYQAYYSYDSSKRANGALITKDLTPLAVIQTDPPLYEGEIVRINLAIEHWETKLYLNDKVEVWVEGIGVIGRLSRPNEADYVDISGDVNIDHGHDHASGGNHDHNFTDPSLVTSNPSHVHNYDNPNFSANNPAHGHGFNGFGGSVVDGGGTALPIQMSVLGSSTYSRTIWYNVQSNVVSANVKLKLTVRYIKWIRASLYDNNGNLAGRIEATYNSSVNIIIDQTINATSFPIRRIDIEASGAWQIGAEVWISQAELTSNLSGSVDPNVTAVTTSLTKSGTVYYQGTAVQASIATSGDVKYQIADSNGVPIKSVDDVEELAMQNVALENIIADSSSKAIREIYDLTKFLDKVDWDWLTNRDVELRYIGTNDDAGIIVTYITFEVEYRQFQRVLTDNITCKPIGLIENRPDAVIQYVLNNIAGIPLNLFGSIYAFPNVWNDLEVWDDLETWVDSGEGLTPPAGAAFEEAAARFEYLGYRFDGVISARANVKDTVKELCRQSRSRILWSGGKVKLAVKDKIKNWVTLKTLDKTEVQLRSISVQKEKIERVYNDIDLFYKINSISGANDESKYDASLNKFDSTSIARHGQRKDNSKWLFNLVRNDSMANDLLDYFIWRFGEPATKYSFQTYLQQFDIEKNDVIRITSNFQKINNLPLIISNNQRLFGSGKLSRINTIQLIGESIRNIYLSIKLEDILKPFDSIKISEKNAEDAEDLSTVEEDISIIQSTKVIETALTNDVINITSIFNKSIPEIISHIENIDVKLTMNLSDSVNIIDSVYVGYTPCFGACGFGMLPFGSKTFEFHDTDDSTGASDEIKVSLIKILTIEDDVIVNDDADVSELIQDSISTNEELIFSSCFGSPVVGSTGFGLTLFGDAR